MRTKDELFRAAQREVAAYRQQAVMQAETARRAAYAAHPALAEADSAHLRAGLGLAKAAALGGNMDTARAALALCQFASFEVERYSDAVESELGISPREYMGKLLNYCRGYAAKFSQNSPNLLFMGHTGLGKTHLALAIADAVLEGGHDVLYTSAAALAAQLGREHFNYTTNDEWLAACQEADLLILDDLGTEYITPLTISVLYELINTRMLTHRPTIYTTNITDQSVFVARYTEKVASRMLGGCKMFKFFGTDQRLK